MTVPSQARALAEAIERNVVALRGPDGNLPPEVEVAYYNLKDALLDAPQPIDRETLARALYEEAGGNPEAWPMVLGKDVYRYRADRLLARLEGRDSK